MSPLGRVSPGVGDMVWILVIVGVVLVIAIMEGRSWKKPLSPVLRGGLSARHRASLAENIGGRLAVGPAVPAF